MEYREFLEKVRGDLTGAMPNYMVSIQEVQKLQGRSYEGLSVKREGSMVATILNLNDYFQKMEMGQDYRSLLLEIVDSVYHAQPLEEQIPLNELADYGMIRDKLGVRLVGHEGNEEMLSNIPHYDMEDMSLVYQVELGPVEGGEAVALLSNEYLNRNGITQEQLHEDAMKNAVDRQPFEIRSMKELLAEMMGFVEPVPEEDSAMYVATNSSKFQGAAVIAYPEFMDTASKRLKGDFYMLPSSTHEVILVPDKGAMSYQELEAIVAEVNNTQVAPEDRLSNKVYHYDCREKVFELAEKFEARRQRREAERPSVLKALEEHKAKLMPEHVVKPQGRNAPAMSI